MSLAHRSAILAGLMTGMLAASPIQPIAGATSSADGDPMEVQQAIRFRETSGFESDRDFVLTSLASSAAFPDRRYGVPLSSAEGAEVDRRLGVQRQLGPARMMWSTQPDNAGSYIDQAAGGIPIFLTTGDVKARESDLRGLLGQVDFQVRQVARSLSDLEEVHRLVSSRLEAGSEYQAEFVGIRPSRNAVVVGVLDTSAAPAWMKELPGIEVAVTPPSELDACTSRYNCPPMKGGIVIHSLADGGERTAGWMGRSLGLAHCAY